MHTWLTVVCLVVVLISGWSGSGRNLSRPSGLSTLNKPGKTMTKTNVWSRWQRAENLESQQGSASHAHAGTLMHARGLQSCV